MTQQKILQNITVDLSDLHYHATINSTNTFLLNIPKLQHKTVCIADEQTAGRGRRGKKWESPPNSNIYLSLAWELPSNPPNCAGLSLAVGIILATLLQNLGIKDIQLKWPNDLLIHHKKCAGILIEFKKSIAVIGIGINLSAAPIQLDTSYQTTALNDHTQTPIDRTQLLGKLINDLVIELEHFNHRGFSYFYPLWISYDAFYNKSIKIVTPQGEHEGVCKGVSQYGELLLNIDGALQAFTSASINHSASRA